jgi:hypothetical protein
MLENKANSLNLMENLFYFNGTNHPVSIIETTDYYTTRRGFSVLTNPEEAKPCMVLNPGVPLSVHRQTEAPATFLFPEGSFSTYDFPENFGDSSYRYDVILVSRYYANQVLSALPRFNFDFADRLWIIQPLYNQDPDRYPDAHRLGEAAGLRKILMPCQPGEYLKRTLNPFASPDQKPSLAAASLSLALYAGDPYCEQLSDYVMTELQRRIQLSKRQA